MSHTDDELLRIRQKDPAEGFRLIYERYSGMLLRFVYRFTGNQEQAEEILHDVFTEVLKADFNSSDFQLKAWLLTVAKNKSLNFERRKKREVVSDARVQAAVDPEILEDQLAHTQILGRIERIETKLPKDLAETWKLRQDGFDYQEIASRLQIPLGTVKSRFSRMVAYFKKEFEIENG